MEFGNPERPEAHNLLSLYTILSGQTREAVANECATIGWGTFKPLLAEATISTLKPIQPQYKELMNRYVECLKKNKISCELSEKALEDMKNVVRLG